MRRSHAQHGPEAPSDARCSAESSLGSSSMSKSMSASESGRFSTATGGPTLRTAPAASEVSDFVGAGAGAGALRRGLNRVGSSKGGVAWRCYQCADTRGGEVQWGTAATLNGTLPVNLNNRQLSTVYWRRHTKYTEQVSRVMYIINQVRHKCAHVFSQCAPRTIVGRCGAQASANNVRAVCNWNG